MTDHASLRAKAFELPAEIADYIRAHTSSCQSVSLAFEDERAQEQGESDGTD